MCYIYVSLLIFFSFIPDSTAVEECLARQNICGQEQTTMWLLDIPQTQNGKSHIYEYIDCRVPRTVCIFFAFAHFEEKKQPRKKI